MEVGHPPGAPFFMVLGRFFTLFAGGDVTKVAVTMNVLSAMASAFTILVPVLDPDPPGEEVL